MGESEALYSTGDKMIDLEKEAEAVIMALFPDVAVEHIPMHKLVDLRMLGKLRILLAFRKVERSAIQDLSA